MIPPDLQSGSDSRRNWPTINGALASLRLGYHGHNRICDAIENLRRPVSRTPNASHPFRVYSTPPSQRPGGAGGLQDDADWWRKFLVQHGYVNNFRTSNCDNADAEWPTSGTDQFPGLMEIEVPLNKAKYYIWIETTLVNGVIHSNFVQDGPDPWPGFPQANTAGKTQTLIARVDTLTSAADNVAIVRQFVHQDINLGGSGGGGMTFRGEWTATIAYAAFDWVLVRGGVNAGAYICVVDVGIGGPAPGNPTAFSNWVQFSPGYMLGQWA